MISAKLTPFVILILAAYAQSIVKDGQSTKIYRNDALSSIKNETKNQTTRSQTHFQPNGKYSSRIAGNRYGSNGYVFGIRTFPFGRANETANIAKTKGKVSPSTEKVLDFRIAHSENEIKGSVINSEDDDDDDDEQNFYEEDMIKASAGGGKQKKEADDDEEKTLSQQVADGKYGLIQNELFANGSKRPGILSYRSNKEVPKDTKENLGGLEKDEIWLAEDHILVLRGGNYQNSKKNDTPSSSVWPPIDNFLAPNRQVKIPKNPEIPPPFPVQLTENGPIEFIKGQNNPSFLPPIIPPPIPPFVQDANKTFPFPFAVVPNPAEPVNKNKSLPFPVPPHLLPPFLSNLPPGATFVAPPENSTDIDEDDPSIYYPPKYDFIYPLDNTTAVPPGPLVPGIILPPPPDFFSLLENDTNVSTENYNETDDSINSITPTPFIGPKYLPALRKPSRTRIPGHIKRPTKPILNKTDSTYDEAPIKPDKPGVTYVYPEKFNKKTTTTTTTTTTVVPTYNSFRTSNKVPSSKYPGSFNSPIFVPNNPNRSQYHPLPTTSPKPNHITLPPTTKSLPKQILIITTPETVSKDDIENIYKKSKPSDPHKFDHISPEIHPLRSLLKPNVTVSYNGKYGHLPPPTNFQQSIPETDVKIIRGHYVTQPPLTKASKVPSTDVNSITVTPIPVVKKVRIQPEVKPEIKPPALNAPPKATLYFYEETTTEEPSVGQVPDKPIQPIKASVIQHIKPETKPVTPYYYSSQSTSKTPIRQFLEETFHSSNVLTRKPQIAQVNNAEIITHNGYSDIPKMKHLNYGTHVSSPRPNVKYHYVTDGNTVVIPTPKIKDLEIKNSGSSGLQTIHLQPISVRPAPKPIVVEPYIEHSPKPETHSQPPLPHIVTANPVDYNTAEGPFIPSDYYATSRPEHIHFTSQEQTLVDDITKNYFTIFGQKINSPSTTPLVPIKPVPPRPKIKPAQESGLSYISEDGHNFKIQQVHETNTRKPAVPSSPYYARENSKPNSSPRPPSNFEKYLKELTGEDQRDYIVSGVFPVKIKKGKGFLPDGIPSHIFPQHSIIFENHPVITRPKVQFPPNLSTTLRPLVDVEIKPQYIQHISSTAKPYDVYQHVQPQSVQINPNLQQYLQEISSLPSPTTKRPVKVKNPNLDFYQNTPSPIPYPPSEIRQKPISLADDIMVNYKPPRPGAESGAEIVRIPDSYDNIKIVDSPDLSRKPNLPYPTSKPVEFDVGKVFFQNMPKPEFYSQPHQNGGNAFVSYNLPGNGGHFYFLTPQLLNKGSEQGDRAREKGFKRVNRSQDRSIPKVPGAELPGDYSSQIDQTANNGYSNSDYLRRRRKKP